MNKLVGTSVSTHPPVLTASSLVHKKNQLSIVILSALGLALSSPLWLPMLGNFLVVADPLVQADGVVVLSGDDERIPHGAQLLQEGFAKWYIVTNMQLHSPNHGRTYIEVVRQKAIRYGVPEERILILPGTVETTYEEAVSLRTTAEKLDFRSVIVVTSPYHTRRARWIMNRVFEDSDVNLIIRPAEGHDYRADGWWRSALNRQQTALEYAKMMAHLLGCRHLDRCGPFPAEWLRALRNGKSLP